MGVAFRYGAGKSNIIDSHAMNKQTSVALWEVTLGFSCMIEGRAGMGGMDGGHGENCQILSCPGPRFIMGEDLRQPGVGHPPTQKARYDIITHMISLVPHPWRRDWVVGNALEDLPGDCNWPTASASNLLFLRSSIEHSDELAKSP